MPLCPILLCNFAHASFHFLTLTQMHFLYFSADSRKANSDKYEKKKGWNLNCIPSRSIGARKPENYIKNTTKAEC